MEQQGPSQILQPGVAQMKFTVLQPTILITDHFWLMWGHIALENEAASLRGWIEGQAAKERGDNLSELFREGNLPLHDHGDSRDARSGRGLWRNQALR